MFNVPNGTDDDLVETDSVFGRGQTVYMRTWGCTHNTSDTEYMAGQLAEAGFKECLYNFKGYLPPICWTFCADMKLCLKEIDNLKTRNS